MRSPCWFLVAALGAIGACGPAVTYDIPPNQNPNGSNVGSAGPTTQAAGDETLTLDDVKIKGQLFEPIALDTYGVSGAGAKKATTLDAQRKQFAAEKDPLKKQAYATILATMLYQDAGKNAGNADADYQEAAKALGDAVTAANNKADELTLELYARYSMMAKDHATADKAWEALVTQYPKNKEVDVSRAWWTYTRLKQYRNPDAAALLQGAAIDKTPELGYVAAWTKWRTGDAAGAWEAMKQVAKQWNNQAAQRVNPDRMPVVVKETLRLGARTGADLKDVAAVMASLTGKQVGEVYEMWKQISAAMHYAGRWQDAINADEQALQVGGSKTPPNEAIAIAIEEMQFYLRLDAPDAAAKEATLAVNAVPNCGSACTAQDAENVYEEVGNIAAYLHSIYAASNDARYYQPAHDLYHLAVPLITDTSRKQTLGNYMGRLEATHNMMKPNTGRLGKDNVKNIVAQHDQEVQACFEGVLAGVGKLSGTVALTLDIQQDGTVRGTTTDPKAGMADVSAAAACIAAQAKTWKFPARGSAGSTRATVKYQLTNG
jgi:hypothetical protein